ncbi:MAG: hypothetical protein ABSF44_05270 [Candidatus Bathyarchaeia archaeon]
MVTSDICELVMFPLIARSTITPSSVVALTSGAEGVAVGNAFAGVGVGVGVGVGINVGVGVGAGVGVGV